MIAALRVIRAAARLQVAQLSTSPFMLFTVLVQPFFIAVAAMYVLRQRADFDPMYVIVGAGLSGLWSVALFDGAWAIQSERWNGTLELIAGSPAPLLLVIAGRMGGSIAFALISMLISYATGGWLFGYAVVVGDPGGFALALVFALASLWTLAVLFAPVGILWRTIARFLDILEYPIYTLAGFLFPVVLLPVWSRPLSAALPPYWAAVALHGTAAGALGTTELITALAAMTTGSGVALLLAWLLLRAALTRAREAGTLALS